MEDKIKEKLKELVKPKRYKHSMFVAEEARKLAKIYNEPVEKAYLTGLAHDIAKSFDNKENEKWIKRYDLDEKWLSKENEKLIHAEVGAVVAKEYFDFDDEMCNAIKYHTTGREDMSILEKIIYLADATEEGREYCSTQYVDIIKNDIDKGMVLISKWGLNHILEKDKIIHLDSIRCYNYYLKPLV